MQDSLAGVVVFFHPPADVFQRIQTYLPHLKRLYLVDNSPQPAVLTQPLSEDPRISYHFLKGNKGIAAALNEAARLALNEGHDWLLTMDQDGRFEQQMAQRYFEGARRLAADESVALISPAHVRSRAVSGDFCEHHEPETVMTSGNLVRLDVLADLGGYDEALFIDTVDHDYCLRVRRAGLRVLQFKHISIEHSLGQKQTVGRNRVITTHPPARLYWMTRNNLRLWRLYGKDFPAYIRHRQKFYFFTTLKNIFLYQDQKKQRLVCVVRGLWHFLCNRYGANGEVLLDKTNKKTYLVPKERPAARVMKKIVSCDNDLTILTLFSGNRNLLPLYTEALRRLKKPERTQLLFVHNETDPDFHEHLLTLTPDVFYFPVTLEEKHRGSLNHEAQIAKAAVCAELYQEAKQHVRGRDVLILEHDVLPPEDAWLRLTESRHFYRADLMAAVTVSRHTGEYQAWRFSKARGTVRPVWMSVRPKRVTASAFGFLLLSQERFQTMPLIAKDPRYAFFGCDMNAGLWAREQNLRWFVDGRVRCKHLGTDLEPCTLGRLENTLAGPLGVLRRPNPLVSA